MDANWTIVGTVKVVRFRPMQTNEGMRFIPLKHKVFKLKIANKWDEFTLSYHEYDNSWKWTYPPRMVHPPLTGVKDKFKQPIPDILSSKVQRLGPAFKFNSSRELIAFLAPFLKELTSKVLQEFC